MRKLAICLFYALLLCLGLAVTESHANQAIVFGGWSSHSDSTYTYEGVTRDYNENNYSLGYGYNDFYVVAAKLSFHNWGVIAYYDYNLWEWSDTSISLRLGAVYGYKNTPQNTLILPIVLPTLTQRLYGELYFQASILANEDMYVATGNLLYKF
jgi:hypothetical protein